MSAIAPGDVVYVVKGHCPGNEAKYFGRIVRVEAVRPSTNGIFCEECGLKEPERVEEFAFAGTFAWPAAWLRKFKPLTEAEKRETTERVPA